MTTTYLRGIEVYVEPFTWGVFPASGIQFAVQHPVLRFRGSLENVREALQVEHGNRRDVEINEPAPGKFVVRYSPHTYPSDDPTAACTAETLYELVESTIMALVLPTRHSFEAERI